MAIYPNNKAVECLFFEATVGTIREAAILFREGVGQIKSLNDSLLGRNPNCTTELEINLKEHQLIRQFFDEEELRSFQDYLSGLLERADPQNRPEMVSGCGGFSYTTNSSRAAITIQRCEDGNWTVSGRALFLRPLIVERNLRSKGFTVHKEIVE